MLLGQTDNRLIGLGHGTSPLDAVELNMAVRGDVWGDATVSAVGPSTASNGALDGDVADDALLGVESLSLSVALEVKEEFADGLCGLFGPSTESLAELSSLSSSTDTSEVSGVGDATSVSEDILEILLSLGDA